MSFSPTAHPLCWPDGWPRTDPADRQAWRGDAHTTASAYGRLLEELRRIDGVSAVVVSTDIPVQRNGRPYSGEPLDPGVAVWWRVGDGPWLCVAIDRFRGAAYNMRAAMLVIEGRRREARYGTDALQAASWSVFEVKALPVAKRPWHEVLGVSSTAPVEVVEAAYRALARVHHPDAGGDPGRMAEINAAVEEARG